MKLQQDIEACTVCRDSPLETPLPVEPRPVVRLSATARLCIAGQAPGLRVHESGQPFNDASGDRLRQWMGVDRDTFYDTSRIAIVPMGFCFPGYDKNKSDLPPRKECRLTWHDAIFEQMQQVDLLLAIGQYAQSYHLGTDQCRTMTETVAAWRTILSRETHGPRVLALPHPSWRNTGWLKRNPWFEADVLPWLQGEVRRLTAQ